MMVIRLGEAREYCYGRSRILRLWRRKDRPLIDRLIGEAVWCLPARPPVGASADVWRERLRGYFAETMPGRRAGNPVMIWILLNVVVPIIVRLVVEWWLSRDEQSPREHLVPVSHGERADG